MFLKASREVTGLTLGKVTVSTRVHKATCTRREGHLRVYWVEFFFFWFFLKQKPRVLLHETINFPHIQLNKNLNPACWLAKVHVLSKRVAVKTLLKDTRLHRMVSAVIWPVFTLPETETHSQFLHWLQYPHDHIIHYHS